MLLPGLLALAGLAPVTALAETTSTQAPAVSQPAATTTVPAPTPPPAPSPSPVPAPATAPAPTQTTTQATTEVPPPQQPLQVKTQRSQRSVVVPAPATIPGGARTAPHRGEAKPAVAPSSLTPPLPSALGAPAGVPSFFIDSFSIPPFLLPIYQAAGAAYGIPWQVLAAINEVETDYGRDLNVSSAGAEGWMQFLPGEWGQYGVDVNNDGFEDPYNPADAIFAAARYLKDAGGDADIRAAVFAYNHSKAYVNSVMLRARLLGGTPPRLLGAITGLTEARFPVYAASHYSDGFPTSEDSAAQTIVGTAVYSQPGAPVIAVQDGQIVEIGTSGPLGLHISLRDAYGNTYTYGELGTLASLYPVLEAAGGGAPPTPSSTAVRTFKEGSENVYLHSLQAGANVIAGTVLGHLAGGAQPHMTFQIRPAGVGAPLIDPKPILDGWVKLQSSSPVRANSSTASAAVTPTAGQSLLESKRQLEREVLRQKDIELAGCERSRIADGRIDRRVLAGLAFLAASGLRVRVSSSSCRHASPLAGRAVDISAVNGVPVAGQSGSQSPAGQAVERLLSLQGAMKPLHIAGPASVPGVSPMPGGASVIRLAFAALSGGAAHTAGVFSLGLSPAQWVALIGRLGQVPDPSVGSRPSPAAIRDTAAGTPSTQVTGG